MAGNKIQLKDGFYHLEGHVDERVDYQAMASDHGTIKLSCAKVQSVNSVGVKAFLEFVRNRQGRLELHQLSTPMIDLINAIPGALGNPPDPSIVKSLIVTWTCPRCVKDENVLIALDLKGGVAPKLPRRTCQRCRGALETTIPEEDYFIFITAGD